MKDASGKVVRKTLTKKEVLKLKPGQLIRVCWLDGDDTIHLVTHKPYNSPGEVDVRCWTKDSRLDHDFRFVNSTQVVEVLGEVDFDLFDDSTRMAVHTKSGTTYISL